MSHRYRNKVVELSDTFRDRLAPPIDTAVYWIEYVIKQRGAPFLSYPGQQLNFFQTYCLDIIAAFLVVLYVIKRVVVGTFRCIFRTLRSKLGKSNKTSEKKKKH